jgi:hypothetical protein
MENCKGVTTPINPNEKLSKEMCPKTEEEKKAVEKLPYHIYIWLFQLDQTSHTS